MATAAAPQQQTPMALVRHKVTEILANDDARKHIAPFLRPGVSLERVVSTINQVVAENPEILECTPISIVLAVGKGVQQDLEFGETIHLVPFNVKVKEPGKPDRTEKRAKAVRDWKGDIELVKKSGAARDVDAQVFYENELFVYHQGTSPYIEHHPIVDPAKRGKMIGAYAWAIISQRQPMKVAVLSYTEIDAIRQEHSKRWKLGPIPPWYARKTMVHQITKALPKNPRLRELEREIEAELQEEIPVGEFEVVAEERSGAVASSPAQPEPAASGPSRDREAIAEAAPTGELLATKDQIYDLLDMVEHEAIDEDVREKVKTRIKTGLNARVAATWKGMLEEKIAESRASNELFAGAKA